VLPGAGKFPTFRFHKFLQELRMLKKVAALILACASLATWVGCGSTSSHYLYAAIPGSNEIVVFREDPNSGVLTELTGSPVSAGLSVQSLVLHPSKKFLYAANSGDQEGDVSLYTISSTGAITEVLPRTPVGTAPTLLAMDAAGAYLYVANSGSFNISVFSISASTGVLTPVQIPGGNPFPIGMTALNMAISPTGVLYVTGETNTGIIEAFTVTNGVPTLLANPFVTGNDPYGLAIAPTGGFLYTANDTDNSISEFTVNSDGSLTPLANSPIGQAATQSGPIALLIDGSGKYLYVVNEASSPSVVTAYSIGSDGSVSLLSTSPFGTGAQPTSLAADPSGKYLFVGNAKSSVIQSFSVASDGALTSVFSYGVAGTPTSIVLTP